MIKITVPISCITMMKEELQSDDLLKMKEKKKDRDGFKGYTFAEALKFNSIKESYFGSFEEPGIQKLKIAG